MSNLDPQTGEPLTSPVPVEGTSGGVGASAFPADGATGEDHAPRDGEVTGPTVDPPEDGGPSSDLTREAAEPTTRGSAGDLLSGLDSEA